MAERDFLAAVRERVVVFDGDIGATLEQFDLTSEDYVGLANRYPRGPVLNRPDVIAGVHASMVEARAQRSVETDTFQGSRLKLDEWGLGEERPRSTRRAARGRPRGRGRGSASSPGLDRPDRPPGGVRRPHPRRRSRFGELVEVFAEQAGGPDRGRRRPDHHRDRAGHPRGQGGDLRRPRGVQATRPRRCRSRPASRCCRKGGKMLLGTDIAARCSRPSSALDVDVLGLNCSTGPGGHARRDPLPRRELARCRVHCIPNAGIPHQGPGRRDDLPRGARAAGRDAGMFARVAAQLRPGGRFVLGDVVVPDDPADVVTPIDDDQPSTINDQVRWHAAAGLGVEVVWTRARPRCDYRRTTWKAKPAMPWLGDLLTSQATPPEIAAFLESTLG